MNKTLAKAVTTRSRLRNKFIKNPTKENGAHFKKHRNYCTRLFKKEKKRFYNKINIKLLTDKNVLENYKTSLFGKHTPAKKITSLESDKIISDDSDIAEYE